MRRTSSGTPPTGVVAVVPDRVDVVGVGRVGGDRLLVVEREARLALAGVADEGRGAPHVAPPSRRGEPPFCRRSCWNTAIGCSCSPEMARPRSEPPTATLRAATRGATAR